MSNVALEVKAHGYNPVLTEQKLCADILFNSDL